MSGRGRVAAITGAGSGIGRGIAAALAASGMRVVANDVDPDGLDETLQLVRAAGSDGVACIGDVRRREDVGRIVDEAVSVYGGLDLMVVWPTRRPSAASPWEQRLDHLQPPALCLSRDCLFQRRR